MLSVYGTDGQFTGIQYPEDKQEYRDFHKAKGQSCLWISYDIVDRYEESIGRRGRKKRTPVYKILTAVEIDDAETEHYAFMRKQAYLNESDGLKMEADYDALMNGTEPDYTAWKDKVTEIKDRHKKPKKVK